MCKTASLRNTIATGETFTPGSPNMSLPCLNDQQAQLYLANERLAAAVARKVLARFGISFCELHVEDVVMQSQNGFMRGLAAFKLQTQTLDPEAITKAQVQYGLLCAKRAVEKRLKQFSRWHKADVRRVLNDVSKEGKMTVANVLEQVPESETPKAAILTEELLGCLGGEERNVLEAKFGIGRNKETTQEVADRLGKTRNAVKRIHQEAIGRLRTAAQSGAFD